MNMVEITENGKKALKLIFTDFLMSYNSYNLKDKLGLSNAGSLKLLRKLKERNLLISEKMGNAIFYKLNLNNNYLLKLLELIFMEHGGLSSYTKGWIEELKAFIPLTKAIILFGSVLKKDGNARDVDVCFVLKSGGDYGGVQARVHKINEKNRLKIHPLYITEKELERKLKERDKPLVEMVKSCVIVHGYGLFVRVMKNVNG